jgi:hypothetical protein
MPLGLILGSIGRSMRRKRTSSLNILSSKRAPRDYYKGKNCKPTGFHTRKGETSPDLNLVVLICISCPLFEAAFLLSPSGSCVLYIQDANHDMLG